MRVSMQIGAMALALGAMSVAVRSQAATDGLVRSRMVIHFSDLNLNTAHDAKTMMRRIQRGASNACGGEKSFSSYTGGPDDSYDECRATAIRKAVEQLDAPLVSHLYAAAPRGNFDRLRAIVAGARN